MADSNLSRYAACVTQYRSAAAVLFRLASALDDRLSSLLRDPHAPQGAFQDATIAPHFDKTRTAYANLLAAHRVLAPEEREATLTPQQVHDAVWRA